ncbi:uncharacterized protein [Onthophagus taurus]|uniref:uncharacterized protein n=1 Tax=Onthophagus taurus TaxID=166361 RepID=UPI000C2005F7|nr:uncharacterized protein LOC111424472 [Onthophagus taurus]
MDGMGDAVLNNGSCDSLPFEPENRLEEIQDTISETSKVKINSILKEVDTLTPVEKLLLYFKLPTEKSLVDPLKQPTNPLGSRVEINLTIQWIKTHLEEDPDISLQKKNVYDEYTSYCSENQIKPLSTADFGKVMKQVYPRVKPRRLGTRGNSQYCYSGLRTRIKLGTPGLPDLSQKPQSTEFTIWNDSDVFAAVWCIIKEWSETKLGSKFNSWFNLAHFLVKNHSIGAGTNAASVIISAIQNEQNGDLTNAVNSNRHKEAIRKLQQKCEGKEQKRKLQVQQVKQEPKSRSKKPKVVLPSSTSTSRGSSPSSSSSSAENKLQSPQLQGPKQVCDIDFRNGAAATQQQDATPPLLAAVSFHRPPAAVEGKVAIPRLPTASKQQQLQSPPDSTAPRSKNMKYKHIQPKCDMSTYNLQQTTTVNVARGSAANHRSQETLGGKLNSRKLKKREETVTASFLEDDTTELLSRQRLISVGNLDKDALDEYLGKNNSQETEEEIMHYYENSRFEDTNKTIQLSQLRSLLEQSTTVQDNNANLKSSLKQDAPVVLPNFQASLGRRRVSFDPQYPEEVPPSPNTRTKNYSFTPISPGSKSPKSSSATPSPFVSPRNTPLPRARGNSHPYLLTNSLSKKRKNVKEFDVTQVNINMPMSAPPSPKVAFSHNTQPTFTYNVSTNVQNDQLSAEVSSLFDSLPPATDPILMRSQSVPVNVAQNFNTIPFYDYNFHEQLQTTTNQLTSDQLTSEQLTKELSTSEHTFGPVDNILTNSIDLNSLKINPSRSVPSTPIPVQQPEHIITNAEVNSYSSRSYPSTPMTNETFQYGGKTKDYLLNGQPIKDKKPDEDIAGLPLIDMEGLEIGHGLQGLDAIDNKEDGFFVQLDGTVTGFTVKQNEEDFEGIDGDYFKGVTDG